MQRQHRHSRLLQAQCQMCSAVSDSQSLARNDGLYASFRTRPQNTRGAARTALVLSPSMRLVFYILIALPVVMAQNQSYGSLCTPLVNPYTGFSPVSMPLINCGQCVFTTECQALKGLSVPSTAGMATGCELLSDPNIQVRCERPEIGARQQIRASFQHFSLSSVAQINFTRVMIVCWIRYVVIVSSIFERSDTVDLQSRCHH
jgi:hypothetical protein